MLNHRVTYYHLFAITELHFFNSKMLLPLLWIRGCRNPGVTHCSLTNVKKALKGGIFSPQLSNKSRGPSDANFSRGGNRVENLSRYVHACLHLSMCFNLLLPKRRVRPPGDGGRSFQQQRFFGQALMTILLARWTSLETYYRALTWKIVPEWYETYSMYVNYIYTSHYKIVSKQI